jgi:hypothetical protein
MRRIVGGRFDRKRRVVVRFDLNDRGRALAGGGGRDGSQQRQGGAREGRQPCARSIEQRLLEHAGTHRWLGDRGQS